MIFSALSTCTISKCQYIGLLQVLSVSAHFTGVTFSLRGDSISTSGDVMLNINDIGGDNANAVVCQSERPSSEVSRFANWYIDPDGTSPNADNDAHRLSAEDFEAVGWNRERTDNRNNDPQVTNLRRQSPTAVEGYFTCQISDDTNTPSGLFILYPCELLAAQCDIQLAGY